MTALTKAGGLVADGRSVKAESADTRTGWSSSSSRATPMLASLHTLGTGALISICACNSGRCHCLEPSLPDLLIRLHGVITPILLGIG